MARWLADAVRARRTTFSARSTEGQVRQLIQLFARAAAGDFEV